MPQSQSLLYSLTFLCLLVNHYPYFTSYAELLLFLLKSSNISHSLGKSENLSENSSVNRKSCPTALLWISCFSWCVNGEALRITQLPQKFNFRIPGKSTVKKYSKGLSQTFAFPEIPDFRSRANLQG